MADTDFSSVNPFDMLQYGAKKTPFGSMVQPRQTFTPEDIDKMIEAYRTSGLQGLRALGEREQQGAVSRLASMGMELSPSMQQSLFSPLFTKLAEARTGFEGNLAGVEAQAKQGYSNTQAALDQAQYDRVYGSLMGLLDLAGTYAIGKPGGSKTKSGTIKYNTFSYDNNLA